MRFAICDDDCLVFENLIFSIKEVLHNQVADLYFDTYFDAESLLASNRKYDIIFIDIFMDGMNGVEAASILLPDFTNNLIFLTSSRDFAIEAFRLGAKYYLLKPIQKEELRIALERCTNGAKSENENTLLINISSSTAVIPYSKLLYVESINRRTVYHLENMTYMNYDSLSSVYEKLDPLLFMRAQRSYIVNMERISQFSSGQIVITDGTTISLSRGRFDELKKQYQAFLFGLTRRLL